VPRKAVDQLAETGVLGAFVPARHGGTGWSHAEYGEANRLLGAVSASAQSLLTVHAMVCQALARWASPALRDWLPRLASGAETASFALTEPNVGSDVRALESTARRDGADWVLRGVKRWISFGLLADVFLVFAATESGDAAFAVRAGDPGVRIEPEPPPAGFRAANLAQLVLDECRVPGARLVGRPGFGLAQVGVRALTLGRLCVAFGAVGLAQACGAATLEHIAGHVRFGRRLKDFQLVQGMVADAHVAVEGALLLAARAARSLDEEAQWAVGEVLTAKLAASRAATLAARASAQLHGAQGLAGDGAVQRRLRDAAVFELIEGNTQLLQQLVAEQVVARWRSGRIPGGGEGWR
jgi:alkylation response protein AidB-like acyl-CoA dehydrogenase